MDFVVTLVATHKALSPDHFADLGLAGALHWLAPAKAAFVTVTDKPPHSVIVAWRARLAADAIDVFVTPASPKPVKLLLCDMDSTIVAEETLDMLADHAGCGAEIAAITARSMRGEIEFEQALRDRVARLAGQPESLLETVRAQISFNSGAQVMCVALKMAGAHSCLVTGGFDIFAAYAAQACGFDEYHANHLDIQDKRLTGKVREPILGRHAKQEIMFNLCRDRSIDPACVLAIGDGANDLPLLQAAGLGIGYHPKPLLQETLDNCIIHGDLTAVLYALGGLPPGARG